MVNVCDAIMGTGKTSAVITHMNEHPEGKYIYITPYLEEAKRIKDSCPSLRFVEPSKGIEEFGFTKTGHTLNLLETGRNVATTHQAFTYYTSETIDAIRRGGYTLFIDESVNVLENFNFDTGDLEVLLRGEYIEEKENRLRVIDDSYSGSMFRELMRLMRSRELIRSEDEDGKETLFYWVLPPELICAFKDVFILTYLFPGQDIHHFLEMYSIPYQYIGVQHCADTYRFCEETFHIPPYAGTLSQYIHICEHQKLNQIGESRCALSMNWFKTNPDKLIQLKNNIYNYFRNITGDEKSKLRMWGTFDKPREALRGRGYSNMYVVFNERAKNTYRERRVLAYVANVFMNTGQKHFFAKLGVDASDEIYALSTMVQWIWRSAIRDGHEIWIYIPSRRMRELLKSWIADVERQYHEYASHEVVVNE